MTGMATRKKRKGPVAGPPDAAPRGPRGTAARRQGPPRDVLLALCAFVLVALWRGTVFVSSGVDVVLEAPARGERAAGGAAGVSGEGDAMRLPPLHEMDDVPEQQEDSPEETETGEVEASVELEDDPFSDGDGVEEGVEDDDEDEDDEALPDSKRTTVLLSKETIRKVNDRERTRAAYAAAVELYQRVRAVSLAERAKLPLSSLKKSVEAERHFTRGYWFVPGRKYFVYQPSGGMSNQRIILERAVIIARALGRTLVVPPVGPHTSMFWNYNKVDWERTVDAFRLFQRERMEAVVPVLGLTHCILRRFVEFNENKHNQQWLRVQRDKKRSVPWTTSEIKRMFGGATEDVLFFAQTTMWRGFKFTREELEMAEQHVQLHAEFRRVARVAVEHLFPQQQPFNAVHIRFEDKYTQIVTDVLSPARSFVRRLERSGAQEATPRLYVATQPGKSGTPYFEAFRAAGFELTFSDTLLNISEVRWFMSEFPVNDIQSSIIGLLEQLVCARADNFLGTGFSTFSRYIRVKRNNKALVYDESLLPAPREESFLSTCDDAAVGEALAAQVAAGRGGASAVAELALVSREPRCENKPVSLKVC